MLTITSIVSCAVAFPCAVAACVLMQMVYGYFGRRFEEGIEVAIPWTFILGCISSFNHFSLHHRLRKVHPDRPYAPFPTTLRLIPDLLTVFILLPESLRNWPRYRYHCDDYYWDDEPSSRHCRSITLAVQIIGTTCLVLCVALGVIHAGLALVRLNLLWQAMASYQGGEFSLKFSIGMKNFDRGVRLEGDERRGSEVRAVEVREGGQRENES